MKLNKNVIKVVCFSLIFCFLFQSIAFVLRDKSNSEYIMGFENEMPYTLDVLFFGSSMSYRQVYPLELWGEFGITSYNLGSSEQIIPLSYYVLQHALETQKPKVVVVDMGMCTVKNKNFSDARLHQVWDNLSWSNAKHESIQDLAENPETFYFDIIQYHTRWKEIAKETFKRHIDYEKGAGCYLGTKPLEPVILLDDSEQQNPPKITIEYLDKIIVLCEENNIELLLTGMPTEQFTEERQKMFHYIESYVQPKDVKFINFYTLMDELSLSWETDFADSVHMNYPACRRVTKYIGEYLQTYYKIPDHRGEEIYKSWDEDWNKYKQRKKI